MQYSQRANGRAHSFDIPITLLTGFLYQRPAGI